MALQIHHGTFTAPTSNGTQVIDAPAFQPDIFIVTGVNSSGSAVSDMRLILGAASGTTAADQFCISAWANDGANPSDVRRAYDENCVVLSILNSTTIKERCDVQSFDALGVTLDWTATDTTGLTYNYVAIKGGSWAAGHADLLNTTGTDSVSGLSFDPDTIIAGYTAGAKSSASRGTLRFCVGQAVSSTNRQNVAVGTNNAVDPTDSARIFNTDSLFEIVAGDGTSSTKVDFTSLDTGGFTYDVIAAPTVSQTFPYIAVGGVDVYLGTFTQKTTNGTDPHTGWGFQPEFNLFQSYMGTSLDTSGTNANFAIGSASSSTSRSQSSSTDQDAVTTANSYHKGSTTEALRMLNPGTGASTGDMDFTTNDSDGITVDWTNVSGAARQISVWSIAETVAPGGFQPAWARGVNTLIQGGIS